MQVAIAYVPTDRLQQHGHWMGYRDPAVRRILMVCCGPSVAIACPVGARTVCPCAHGVFCLFAGCVAPTNPAAWHSTHGSSNYMVPWSEMPDQFNLDIQAGTRG